jgi:hypothetical protein
MDVPSAKRRKSDDVGLLGLLGAYQSEEEEENDAASPFEADHQSNGTPIFERLHGC